MYGSSSNISIPKYVLEHIYHQVKKEEIEAIMNEERRLIWKAFFMALYESGLRPIELRTITWDRINLNSDGDLTELNIFATKTSKARSVYVKEATKYLKKLKETRKDNNPLVFPSPRDPSVPISKNLVAMWLNRISRKTIGRKIHPYLLRHSRATQLYKKIPVEAQKVLGHSRDMRDVYLHLDKEDVKQAMKNIMYSLDDIPQEKRDELEEGFLKLREEVKRLESNYKKEIKNILKTIS